MREYGFTVYDETYKDEDISPGVWPLWAEHSRHYQRGGTSEEWQAAHIIQTVIVLSDQGLEDAKEKAKALFEEEVGKKTGHVILSWEIDYDR